MSVQLAAIGALLGDAVLVRLWSSDKPEQQWTFLCTACAHQQGASECVMRPTLLPRSSLQRRGRALSSLGPRLLATTHLVGILCPGRRLEAASSSSTHACSARLSFQAWPHCGASHRRIRCRVRSCKRSTREDSHSKVPERRLTGQTVSHSQDNTWWPARKYPRASNSRWRSDATPHNVAVVHILRRVLSVFKELAIALTRTHVSRRLPSRHSRAASHLPASPRSCASG